VIRKMKITMSSDNESKVKKVPFGRKQNGRMKNNGALDQGRPTPLKLKFIGECEAFKECVVYCASGNQYGAFKASIKKLYIYVEYTYAM
jgi:hypothetical protein